MGQMGPAERSYPLGVIEPKSTPWRLLASLKTLLWVVLVLCAGMASANRTVDPLNLHQADGLVKGISAEDGCFFLRARWMDPNTGRFVSEDPYAGDPNGPVSLHRYLYASATPLQAIDPRGEYSLMEMEIALAIVEILNVHYLNVLQGFLGGVSESSSSEFDLNNEDDDPSRLGPHSIDEPAVPDLMEYPNVIEMGVSSGFSIGARALARIARPSGNFAGVYVLRTSKGVYIGQSCNVGKRVANHFSKTGKLNSLQLEGLKYYPMRGSTKAEREIYEHYLISKSKSGAVRILNRVYPMGGRVSEFKKNLDRVTGTFFLPM